MDLKIKIVNKFTTIHLQPPQIPPWGRHFNDRNKIEEKFTDESDKMSKKLSSPSSCLLPEFPTRVKIAKEIFFNK